MNLLKTLIIKGNTLERLGRKFIFTWSKVMDKACATKNTKSNELKILFWI